MKYLVSLPPEKVAADQQDVQWAPAGEPVVPWFPAPPDNVFVAIGSFKKSPYAIVVDADINPDKLSATLQKQYPGLPSGLIDNYVVATAKAAAAFPVGTRMQVTATKTWAKVFPYGKAEEAKTLWDTQPF